MKYRIKRFDPIQAGKVLGLLYAASGLLFAPFMLLYGALATKMIAANGGSGGVGAVGILGGVFGAVLMPVMYGVMGFIFGVLSALFYNLIVKMAGGIEMDLEAQEV